MGNQVYLIQEIYVHLTSSKKMILFWGLYFLTFVSAQQLYIWVYP